MVSRAAATNGDKVAAGTIQKAKLQRTPGKRSSVRDVARPFQARRSAFRTPPKRQNKVSRRKKSSSSQETKTKPLNAITVDRECPATVAKVSATNLESLEAIVISLERRPDRMVGCAARLNAYCPWLKYSPVKACDGRVERITPAQVQPLWHTGRNCVFQRLRAIRKGWDDLDTYKERSLVLSPGEQGCAVSHIRAWERCIAQSGGTERPLLVLEDDAAPTPEFTAVLTRALAALPRDAHVLYLGYSQAADWKRVVSPELVEAMYVWTTVGYIIWPAGARLLLSRLPVNQPVDNWMAGLCADNELKAYCVKPKIILQADAWNVNSDVAHSDEHYWGPNSDIQHSDEFYWGPEAEHDGTQFSATAAGSLTGTGSLLWDIDSDDSEDGA